MKTLLVFGLMGVLVCAAGADDRVYVELRADNGKELNYHAGIPQEARVTTVEGGVEGKAFKVTYEGFGAASVLLRRVPLDGLDDAVLWYEGWVKSAGLVKPAYLEMWCEFADGGKYFSRALDGALQGDQPWRRSQTPFFLDEGAEPTAVYIGVRFEGPGVVYLDDIRVLARPRGMLNLFGSPAATLGILGGIAGTLVGIWGALVGFLASRGQARGFVLSSAAVLLFVGVVSAVTGLVVLLVDATSVFWHPLLLLGAVLTLVISLNLPTLRHRYAAIEAERMLAIDESESV